MTDSPDQSLRKSDVDACSTT